MAGNYVLIPKPPQYYILFTASARRACKKTGPNGPEEDALNSANSMANLTKQARKRARNRVTSHDVARLAGVSQAAVSRVYRQGASASAEMREKVREAARQLGYRPNAIARGLSSRRSNMVALIMLRQTNLTYPDSLVEISSSFSARGIQVLLFSIETYDELDDTVDRVLQYQVDGVVIGGTFNRAQRRAFDDAGIPVIYYGLAPRGAPYSCVDCDNGKGTEWLAEKLLSAGHRRFGIMAGPKNGAVARVRTRMLEAGLRAGGADDVVIVHCGYEYENARRGFVELMRTNRRLPDAVAAITDSLAIGSIDEARENFGLDVPGDISITGFEGVRIGGLEPYKLTTIRLPRKRMAAAVVDLLTDRIEDPDLSPEVRLFTGIPVPGQTVRNANDA